ncbi:MAG TPA: mechanosensitive ion channel domain-containing protein [Burkholderiaceae bacterium]|nr:mechanosensitive ion channel domain-containing protein [Burkholderiaceae bacterium]
MANVLGRLAPKHALTLKRLLRMPGAIATPLLVVKVLEPDAAWAGPMRETAAHAQHVALIMALAWLLLRLISAAELLLVERLGTLDAPASASRKARTQIALLRKFLGALIGIVAAALILMRFTAIRNLGTSLLASAGAAGIIFGIAAQRSIGNVVAGFQILFTQPLRIDDAVVVEGEWGTVEELTLTYVVVRLWDFRRLILPITYFIEKPFQNWTRSSTNILGTVFFWVDFDTDIDELRALFLKIVGDSKLWDRATASLQVTDASESAIQLRCLLSAADAGNLWNLRCEVREALFKAVRASGKPIWPQRRLRGMDRPAEPYGGGAA